VKFKNARENFEGFPPLKFWDHFQLDKTMRDAEMIRPTFLPTPCTCVL